MWVSQHRDNELYSGGYYTNQSNGRAEGIKSFVARKDNVENEDCVLWHTFGLTRKSTPKGRDDVLEAHHPFLASDICRVEDFPVVSLFLGVDGIYTDVFR